MMYMFCGDSHSRQFQANLAGHFSFTSFTGATLKGLGSPDGAIGHHRAVLDMAAVRREKTLVIMFGNVDLDATYYRKLVKDGGVDHAPFFSDRLLALTSFVRELKKIPESYVAKTCILLPQICPLSDDNFVIPTAAMAKVDPQLLQIAVAGHEKFQVERIRRTIAFNDYLTENFPAMPGVELHRIDRLMVDDAGSISSDFVPKNPMEHHAAWKGTLPLWQEALQDSVPAFKKMHGRRMVRAARRTAGGDISPTTL